MPHKIDRKAATALLAEVFQMAEDDFREGATVSVPTAAKASTERLFASKTRAYREALVGCVIAHILVPEIDIRLPATAHGEHAFSGRSLADYVVAPFLRGRAVPISASSPYLSSLRGGARFIPGGEPRIQDDQEGFDALVAIVDYVRSLNSEQSRTYLRYLLRQFIELRESGNIPLKKIAKPNLNQLGNLIDELLTVKSGGRIPALLAVAMFQTVSECHKLGWRVDFQGINVADKASGAVGDITIQKDGAILLGVEVTERAVDQARVTLIFDQKVSPGALSDYLFITTTEPENSAIIAARKYTGVGHEMNFVPLAPWLKYNLATIGQSCRAIFQSKMVDLLRAPGVPAEVRVAWNSKMDKALGIK
jgi:hypothetical protein